jgi:Cu(I)/Ag(I) efflux system membrane fusion protein
MKKLLALAILIALVGTLAFGIAGCKKSEETAGVKKVEETAGQYACSMKCEGDKTYPNPGKCPVCGMALKKVE